ncbi:MAG: signal peptidase I [Oscillospiraceae bacterium]|nr:signal peptidase I [Oscillospiraceae bacterium]
MAGENAEANPRAAERPPESAVEPESESPTSGDILEKSALDDVDWAALVKQTPEAEDSVSPAESVETEEAAETETEELTAPKERKKKSPLRRAFGILGTVLTVLVVAFVLFLFAVLLLGRRSGVNGVSLLGYRMFMVLSGSMEPAYPVGSVVFTQEIPPEDVAPGDVITYYSRNLEELVTHRVVSIEPMGPSDFVYVTKGDANDRADSERSYSWDLLGVVRFQIPFLGYVVDQLRTIWGLIFLVILPATIIIVVELIKLIRFSKE